MASIHLLIAKLAAFNKKKLTALPENVFESETIYQNIFKCKNNIFSFACKKSILNSFENLPGLESLKGLFDSNFEIFESELKELIKKKPMSFWESTFKHSSLNNEVGIMARVNIKDVITESQNIDIRENKFFQNRHYSGLGNLWFIHNPLQFSRSPLKYLDVAPIRGTHTHKIYDAEGLKHDENVGVLPYSASDNTIIWFFVTLKWVYFLLKTGYFKK